MVLSGLKVIFSILFISFGFVYIIGGGIDGEVSFRSKNLAPLWFRINTGLLFIELGLLALIFKDDEENESSKNFDKFPFTVRLLASMAIIIQTIIFIVFLRSE